MEEGEERWRRERRGGRGRQGGEGERGREREREEGVKIRNRVKPHCYMLL